MDIRVVVLLEEEHDDDDQSDHGVTGYKTTNKKLYQTLVPKIISKTPAACPSHATCVRLLLLFLRWASRWRRTGLRASGASGGRALVCG